MASPSPHFDPISEARRQWIERWGSDPAPSMAAVTSIMRAHQILMARLNELLRPFELTFPRYEALMLLFFSRSQAIPLGKVGERLQVHPTSVTNTIDGLERLGYVERSPSERDRRQTLASITAAGRRVATSATAVLNGALFATEPLHARELEQLTRILSRFRLYEDQASQPPGSR